MILGTLIYDGDCGFCLQSKDLLARLDHHGRVALLPLQDPGATELSGVSRTELAESLHWVGADGKRTTGAEAVNTALAAVTGSGLPVTLYRLPVIRQVQDRTYRWVAEHRGRLGSLTARFSRRSTVVDATKLVSKLPPSVNTKFARTLFNLPAPIRKALSGRPIRLDGQTLDPDMRLLLRLLELQGIDGLSAPGGPPLARKHLVENGPAVDVPRIEPVYASTMQIGELRSRLYTPAGLADGSPLLVFFHGGGWVIGDLDTHDNACRFLAQNAGVRVLSVDYRVAPEFPFPAAVDDALTAYHYARAHAAELGADPRMIAVGGDSAGGNLAIVTGLLADPDFVLAFYPSTSPEPTRSRKELFPSGFFITDKDMDYFADYYCPPKQRTDIRFAPALADDLSGMPPTYIATAGFDPLRDDGEAFAAKLAEAGVPVVLRRHRDLIHGYINMLGVGPRPAQALAEAAGTLRSAFAMPTS
ncbi:alpha/beta hydrolase fold domain-containing protein [Sciscionella sediminilitoris]|uniref:alpha/beta hydrolase fold domain-containing protein n=1 Tax=Sciscionella sediminilitoris TaxID=1445613 RepID=UPI0009EC0425